MISVKESCFTQRAPAFHRGSGGLFCRASVENIDGAVAPTEGTGIVVGVKPQIQLCSLDGTAGIGGHGHAVLQITVVGQNIEPCAEGVRIFENAEWKGNIRELENLATYYKTLSSLPEYILQAVDSQEPYTEEKAMVSPEANSR